MKQHFFLLFGMILMVSVCFSSSAFGLDGKTAVADGALAASYLNVGSLYSRTVETLKNLDKPESAGLKTALEQLYTLSKTNFAGSRRKARMKACAANMRVLQGAMEMFNMDHPDMMTGLDINKLVSEKYLLTAPACPDSGVYSTSGDMTKDGHITCSIHQNADDPKEASTGTDSLQPPATLAELVQKFLNFHESALFRPTGGLWGSISPNLEIRFVLEASIKPKALYEWLNAHHLLNLNAPKNIEENLVVFSYPEFLSGGEMVLEIQPTGVKGGVNFPATTSGKGWEDLLQAAANPEAVLLEEVDGNLLKQLYRKRNKGSSQKACLANMRVLLGAVEMFNMDHQTMMSDLRIETLIKENYLRQEPKCPLQGKYGSSGDLTKTGEITCSLHGTVEKPITVESKGDAPLPDPRLESVSRIRLFVERSKVHLSALITDPKVRDEIKGILNQGLSQAKDRLAAQPQLAGPQGEAFRELLQKIQIFEQNDRIGLAAEGIDDKTLLTGGSALVGIAAAIAIPNFKKARDDARKKACYANMRVLAGATEMYNMDNEKPMDVFNMDALLGKGYIKSPPKCPEGGNYLMEGSGAAFQFKCTVHGSVE
jgi:competence protein ComGC